MPTLTDVTAAGVIVTSANPSRSRSWATGIRRVATVAHDRDLDGFAEVTITPAAVTSVNVGIAEHPKLDD